MREIKFRAYHTELKRMFSAEKMGADELTLAVDGRGFVNVSGMSTRSSQYAGRKMIPMQFTGLHDKNGREIYEGDVVKNTQWNRSRVVEWKNGYNFSGFIISGFPIGHGYSKESLQLEVIGNIYENPDLLTPAPAEEKPE